MRCVICEQAHAADEPCAPTARLAGTETRLSQVAALSATLSPVPGQLVAGDDLVGQTVGSFKITRVIGSGGMGTVYLGEQAAIGSKVAIKFLHDHLSTNAGLVQRFYAEARAVNLIGHANIVNIFDMSALPSGRYYLVMEYLDGEALSERSLPMRAEQAVPILVQVCDALAAAHHVKIVHRDLKPENIILVKRGRQENFVKILDFGIAKLFGASDMGREQTAAGMIIGTPEYMAPEQASSRPVDGRSDIYSLGIIGYQLTTGRTPFGGTSIPGILVAHLKEVPPAPHAVNPSVPRALSDAIMKALEKRPEDRFQTADDFAVALEAVFARGQGIYAPPPVPAPPGAPGGLPAAATPVATNTAPPSPGTPAPPSPGRPAPLSAGTPAPPSPGTPAPAEAKPAEAAPAFTMKTPAPAHPRHTVRFDARVADANRRDLGTLPCQDISRGGLFLCSATLRPPVFSRLTIRLPGDATVKAEVVRHVTPEQARAWQMEPGFGVQFLEVTPAQREVIDQLMKGRPLSGPTPPPKNDTDDPQASRLLEAWRKRINGDHYVVLALPEDADFADVRARGRELRQELEAVKKRPLSDAQLAMVESALTRLKDALAVVGQASARMAFDANRGNFRGVWRCIASGLTVTEMEETRARYLADHASAEATAHLRFITATAFENNNELSQALANYEQALKHDPLNLKIQKRYWTLRRKAGG